MAYKKCHQRDEKAYRQKYHMLAKAVWPSPDTAQDSWASKHQGSPRSCYKIDQQGHWMKASPNHWKSKGPRPRYPQEGYKAINCPCVTQDIGTSLSGNPPADDLDLAMDDWRGLSSLEQTPFINSREPGSHHGIWAAHLLPLGHWGHLLSPDGVLGTHLSFLFPCFHGRRTSLPSSPNLTTCIFRGVPPTHSFLVVPMCPVPYWDRIF